MGLVVFILVVLPLVLLLIGAWIGWVLRVASLRRNHRILPLHLPPPNEIYREGFRAGHAAALQDLAGNGADISTVRRSPTSIEGPAQVGDPGTTGRPGPEMPASAAAVPERTPEEAAAEKAARDLRNINIALYSASLLLVAAAGLFTFAAVPGIARASTICVAVAIFYVGGLVLHLRLPRLRPAAVAFTGTGLALVPAAGLLVGVLTGQGTTAWFGTAVIGTAAYLLAAVRLDSRVVAYLALPFFLSIALSSVSLLGGALIWYFTCSIGVAGALAVLVRLKIPLLPPLLAQVVVDTHRLLTPLALAASLVLGSLLAGVDRAVLWVVATVYYAGLLALLTTHRVQYSYFLRFVGTVAVMLVALAAGVPLSWSFLVLTAALALQLVVLLALREQAISFFRAGLGPGPEHVSEQRRERAGVLYRFDVLCSFWVTAIGCLLLAVLGSSAAAVPGGNAARPDALLPTLLLLVLGMVCAIHGRSRRELLVIPGVVLGALPSGTEPWRAEVVLVVTAAYFLARAVRAPGPVREALLLAARAALTVLVPVAVLVHLPHPGSVTVSEVAVLGLLVGLAANCAFELLRHRAAPYGEGTLCVSAGAGLLVTLLFAVTGGSLAPVRAALWISVAVGLAVSLASAPRRAGVSASRPWWRGTRYRERPPHSWTPVFVLESAAPVSLVVVGLVGASGWFGPRSYEVLLVLAVAHAALMAGRHRGGIRRGGYLLAAQSAFSALVVVITRDLGLSVHAVVTVLAVSIAVQEGIRVLLRRRLRDTGLQASSTWLGIGLLAALPLVYPTLIAGPRLGVLVVHLVLLAGVSSLVFVTRRTEHAAYLVLYAVAALVAVLAGALPTPGEGRLPEPLLSASGGALAALVVMVLLTVLRLRSDDRLVRRPCRVGAVVFLSQAVLLALAGGSRWDHALVAAAAAAAAFAWSRREGLPWLDSGGAVAVIIAVTSLVAEVVPLLVERAPREIVVLLLGACLATVLLYLLCVVLPLGNQPALRHRLLVLPGLGWATVTTVPAMIPDTSAVGGSCVLVAAAVLGVLEIRPGLREPFAELAVLVGALAGQRIAWLVLEGIDFFWAAQWWVVTLAILSGYSYLRAQRRTGGVAVLASNRPPRALQLRGPLWLTGGAVILSISGLATVVGGTGGARVWALCGHLALLVAGVALSRRSFTIWGAAGIVLALLWFLRGYTFVLLAIAALLLLAFAVWKLNSQTRPTTPRDSERDEGSSSHSPG